MRKTFIATAVATAFLLPTLVLAADAPAKFQFSQFGVSRREPEEFAGVAISNISHVYAFLVIHRSTGAHGATGVHGANISIPAREEYSQTTINLVNRLSNKYLTDRFTGPRGHWCPLAENGLPDNG